MEYVYVDVDVEDVEDDLLSEMIKGFMDDEDD